MTEASSEFLLQTALRALRFTASKNEYEIEAKGRIRISAYALPFQDEGNSVCHTFPASTTTVTAWECWEIEIGMNQFPFPVTLDFLGLVCVLESFESAGSGLSGKNVQGHEVAAGSVSGEAAWGHFAEKKQLPSALVSAQID